MAKLSAIQNLMRARMAIINHDKWTGYRGLLMYGEFKVVADCPTAYTNGVDSCFGEAFVNSLNDAQIRFLVLHENEHKAQKQLDTCAYLLERDHDHRTLNMAMDFAANQRLMDIDAGEGFIQVPTTDICLDDKYRGWPTQKIYEELRKQGQGKGDGDGKDGDKGEGKAGHGAPAEGDGSVDEHGFEEAKGRSAAERAQDEREIDRVIRQGGIFAGADSDKANKLLEGLIEPTINWREELAEFIKSCTTGRDESSWSRLNRRFVYQGLYLPSTISTTVPRLLIGIDASGSTWCGNQLEGFCSELSALAQECRPEAIDVLWWDTKVTSVQNFKPEDYSALYSKLQIVGGGGTSPSCVTQWLAASKDEYAACIMLSDGQVGSDWGGAWPVPVLWALNTKGITAGTGRTLYIEDTTR